MKRLVVGAAVAAIATISYMATSADETDRPAGVPSKQWVSISPSLGIVLLANEGPPTVVQPSALLLKPPVGGYFMVKSGTGSGWTRLVVVEPLKGPADAG